MTETSCSDDSASMDVLLVSAYTLVHVAPAGAVGMETAEGA